MTKNDLTDDFIKGIAQEMESGLTVYVNLDTGVYHAYTDDFLMDSDVLDDDVDWQKEMKNELEEVKSWEHQAVITNMESRDSFSVMEDFVEECIPNSDPLRRKLCSVLHAPHPFSHFKDLVCPSDYAEKWYNFRLGRNMEYVRTCLEDELDYLEDEE